MSLRLLLPLVVLLSTVPSARAATFLFTDDPIAAIGDGKTDNRPHLKRALDQMKAGDTLIVPPGDYRLELTEQTLVVPANVTIQGHGGKSRFLLASSEDEKKFRSWLKINSNVTLSGLTVQRVEAFPAVLLPMFGELENITLRDLTIDGNTQALSAPYCHAIQVGFGHLKGLNLDRICVQRCSFGLFQSNDATGTVENVVVRQSLFQENKASDLEFNAPRGTMRNITVEDCLFRDNLCSTPGAGFAVGFANVSQAKVQRCDIRNYGSEALHVEDRSNQIALSDNTITRGSIRQTNGVIMVLSNSRDVVIERNTIDARTNDNNTHLILVTAGGKQFERPNAVTIRDNLLVHGPQSRTWYLQPGSGPEPQNNTVVDYETQEVAQ
ncbi:right-handed parallel beta-helix repeat-containing protein [Bremerella sp.]|uniref:right-handed parallel beta-helix repeat-containing protein n=1 Tax=Bremerella sp. TaxID=2795602 RepID=UPI00391DF18B